MCFQYTHVNTHLTVFRQYCSTTTHGHTFHPKLYYTYGFIALIQLSGRLHYELRMYTHTHTHTHVHVTTSLAHYTTHTLGLSHIVWMIPYSRRTRKHLPRRKGLRGRDGNPLRWMVSCVRRKGRRESVNRLHLTKTHVTICTRSCMHTHGEQKILLHMDIPHTTKL